MLSVTYLKNRRIQISTLEGGKVGVLFSHIFLYGNHTT